MFGEKLKKIRTELRLTQEEFGCFLGVTGQCVGYWEKEKRDIPNHTLTKIQSICRGVTLKPILFLFGQSDSPFENRNIADIIRINIINTVK